MPLDERLTALFGGRHLQNPYPVYAALRSEAPAHRHGSSVLVVDYGVAREVFHDTAHFPGTAERGVKLDDRFSLLSAGELPLQREIEQLESNYLTAINGPRHHHVRTAAQRAFSPRRLARIRHAVAELTDTLLDAGRERDSVDIMQLAYRLPLLVVCDILGAEREDAEQLKAWSLDMTSVYARSPIEPTQVRAAYAGMTCLRDYFLELIARNRSDPTRESLLAALDRSDEAKLGDDEIVAHAISVIFAGHETSTNAIGNVLVALLRERTLWERLCQAPDLLPTAIEELLRYDAPVQFFTKGTTGEVEVGGIRAPAGSSVVLAIGSANRDARSFSHPDRVELTRRPNDHLCFGRGVHFCLGAPLARLEILIVVERILARFPRVELAAPVDELRYRQHLSLHGPERLPVHFGPERAPALA
jgi:cytochrome P450